MLKRFAFAGAVSVLANAASAQELVWSGGGDELNAVLNLSVAGTDERPLSFWCVPEIDVVYFTYRFTPATRQDGASVVVELSAGEIRLPAVETAAVQFENDLSFEVEGQIMFNEQFVALISSPGPLVMKAEGKVEEFSLAGAKEAAVPLLKMCQTGVR